MQNDSNPLVSNGIAGLAVTDTAVNTKEASPAPPDPNPAGPTPIDDVASGIQPIADFIPKDAANLSHPTPPPDEPLTSGAADVDTEMANVDSETSSPPSGLKQVQPKLSLVRPREDDGEDEPAAKRSKVAEESTADLDVPVTAQVDAAGGEDVFAPDTTALPDPVMEPAGEPAADPSVEVISQKVIEPATESLPQPSVEPSSAETKVDATQPETQSSDAHEESVEGGGTVVAVAETPAEAKPAETQETAESQPQPDAVAGPVAAPVYSTEPMTSLQKTVLMEKMKNLKKTKNSISFLKPVDPVALNIPSYPEIVKNPMDLGTMDVKLRDGQYGSVQDFANDFDLIIGNVRRFNGDAHPVTQAGMAMEAYFRRVMENVPSADMPAPAKVEKKRSPSISREKPPRRESRAAAAAVPAAGSPTERPFALQSDGTPEIRRQSSNVRPARAIKPPQNREIPYAKPKRREHQLELRFCEHILDEIRGQKYAQWNHVFQVPVDPVALNIPHYRQVIKQPMDLSTIAQKMRNGQYGTAIEFKKDFDLMMRNCLTFNPAPHPVRDLGVQLARAFEALWADKDKWERNNQRVSNRASSASADESAAEEEDDEDDAEDDKTATIRALQKQLADMQNALSGLGGDKPAKAKKAKSSKAGPKKASLPSAPAKSKSAAKPSTRPKKPRQVTYDEKQEISDAVAKMSDAQIQGLTSIITKNCAKYRDMEDMELEIDDLPNEVQIMLLEYVRRIFGRPKKTARDPSPDDAAALDDDDFEPEKGGRGGKRKKHRPMGKKEQQDTIDSIQAKLAQFDKVATSGSESPTHSSFNNANAQAESSGDEESEESEEE